MENLPPAMDPADIDRHFQNSPLECVYCLELFRPEGDEMWCGRCQREFFDED